MMMSGFALMIVGSLMTLLSSLFGIIIGIAFITTGFLLPTHSPAVQWVLKVNKPKPMPVPCTYCFTTWVRVLSAQQVAGSGYTVDGVQS